MTVEALIVCGYCAVLVSAAGDHIGVDSHSCLTNLHLLGWLPDSEINDRITKAYARRSNLIVSWRRAHYVGDGKFWVRGRIVFKSSLSDKYLDHFSRHRMHICLCNIVMVGRVYLRPSPGPRPLLQDEAFKPR